LTPADCDSHDRLVQLKMFLTIIRGDQCEAPNYDSDVLEFQNTWSNFAYIGAGLFILYRRPGLLGLAVGVNLCCLFLFSAMYHATLQPLTQAFDVGWIYAVILSLIVYALASMLARYGDRHLQMPIQIAAAATPTAIGFIVSILKYIDVWHADSTAVTIVLLGVLLVPVLIVSMDWLWLYAWNLKLLKSVKNSLSGRDQLGMRQRLLFLVYIVMPTLLCAVFRFRDGCGKAQCNPRATFQAHALWHILGAISLAMTYDFFAQAADVDEAFLVL
jgi:hypothetical protein